MHQLFQNLLPSINLPPTVYKLISFISESDLMKKDLENGLGYMVNDSLEAASKPNGRSWTTKLSIAHPHPVRNRSTCSLNLSRTSSPGLNVVSKTHFMLFI